MLLTAQDILQALQSGKLLEHLYPNLELKEGWALDYGRKLSALANKQGIPVGWLVVGVDNNGRGTNKTEKWARGTEEIISQHLNQNLDPIQACVSIQCLESNGQWIVAIEVRQPGAVVKWAHEAYKGSGTTIAPMRPEEVMELTIRLPGLTDYSKQPWQGDIAKPLVEAFAVRLAKQRPQDPVMANLADTPVDDALDRVGIRKLQASRILFGDCKFRVVVFDGKANVVSNETKTGLFTILTEEFQQYIQKTSAGMLGTKSPTFPELALREALANMAAHAAYFERDGEILIEIYPDRLVLSNLCLPELGYFANKWFSRVHKSTNALLMETLRLGGLVDELGRGKNLIFRESIYGGKKPPQVFVEPAGRYSRWKLVLPGGSSDKISLRLLERLREIFGDEQKALIAQALVAWRNKPVSEIKKYIDEESRPKFVEVLNEYRGPVFYVESDDRVSLSRWAEVLLGEGKDSKRLSPEEELRTFRFAYRIQTRFHGGVIASSEFRRFASMGDTPSEKALASSILSTWVKKGWLKKLQKGTYKFTPQPELEAKQAEEDRREQLLKLLSGLTSSLTSQKKGGTS